MRLGANDALAVYHAFGYDGTPATDKGISLIDLLEFWQHEGIGGVKIDCFFYIDFRNPAKVVSALAIGGPIIASFMMPLSAESSNQWDDRAASDTSTLRNHAVVIFAYSSGLLRAKSYGKIVNISLKFMEEKGVEAYLPVSEKLRAPSGIGFLQLLQFAARLSR